MSANLNRAGYPYVSSNSYYNSLNREYEKPIIYLDYWVWDNYIKSRTDKKSYELVEYLSQNKPYFWIYTSPVLIEEAILSLNENEIKLVEKIYKISEGRNFELSDKSIENEQIKIKLGAICKDKNYNELGIGTLLQKLYRNESDFLKDFAHDRVPLEEKKLKMYYIFKNLIPEQSFNTEQTINLITIITKERLRSQIKKKFEIKNQALNNIYSDPLNSIDSVFDYMDTIKHEEFFEEAMKVFPNLTPQKAREKIYDLLYQIPYYQIKEQFLVFRTGNIRKVESGDYHDYMHLDYIPYCDFYLTDRRVADAIRFTNRLKPYLNDCKIFNGTDNEISKLITELEQIKSEWPKWQHEKNLIVKN